MIITALLLIIVLALALTWQEPRRNATGIFIVYLISGTILPYILVAGFGRDARTIFPLDSDEGEMAALLVAVFFFSAVCVAKILRSTRHATPPKTINPNRDFSFQSRLLACAAIAIGILYIASMSALMGGITGFIVRSYMRVRIEDSIVNYISVLSWGSFVLSLYSAALIDIKKSTFADRFLVVLACLIGAALSLGSGGRSVIVLYLFAIFFKVFLRASPGKLIVISIIALSGIFVISESVISARYSLQKISASSAIGRSSSVERALTGLTFIDHIALSVRYSDDIGHDFGQSYLAAAGTPIPRQLWQDKPLMLSTRMQAYRFGTSTGGVPPGIIGEAYIAFGFVGVISAAAAFGWLLSLVDRRIDRARLYDDRLSLAFGGVMAPLIGFAMVRGGVDIGVMRVGIPLFWCVISELIVTRSLKQSNTNNKTAIVRGHVIT
jgi:oligosaccharide repeat unit polymerase